MSPTPTASTKSHQRLVELIDALADRLPDAGILVVDDGSAPAHAPVFAQVADRGATVLHAPVNRGKGHALRAGLSWVLDHRPGEAVVTADADGQHTPDAIAAVARRVAPGDIVLGTRSFTGAVPWRSRVGNAVSRALFRLSEGSTLTDTQTGLRGVAADALPWLVGVPGDRYEYEYQVLLGARAAGLRLVEVPIATVYLDANASSHFRPLRDSLRIHATLLRFVGSSLAGWATEVTLWGLLWTASGSVLAASVGARAGSAAVNYSLNRRVVFSDRGSPWRSGLRYAALALALLTLNTAILVVLIDGLGLPGLPAKLAVEAGLSLLSYAAQRRFVFRAPPSSARTPRPRPVAVP